MARPQDSPEERTRRREYWQGWYAANLEERKRKSHEYYVANRERIRRKQAEYNERNRESLRAYFRTYHIKHQDRKRAIAKARYWNHRTPEFLEEQRVRHRELYARDQERREYARRWQQDNRERHRRYLQVSQARRRGAEGEGFTAARWAALVATFGGRCAYCGVPQS